MKTLTFCLFLLGFTFTACVDLKKDEYTQRITKLETALGKIEHKLLFNKLGSLPELKRQTEAVELRIKNYLVLDTIDLITGKKIQAYKIMIKNWTPIWKQFSQLKDGIKEESRTLKNLRKDIESGAGDRASYEQYLLFEKNKVTQLDVLLQDYLRLKKENLQTYQSLHKDLNLFSLELLRKHNLRQ